MKLTVLGATGGIGGHVVQQALSDGHQVTAVVRDPTRLTLPDHPQLEVATADVMDPSQLASLIAGRDAVISALGHRGGRGPTTVCFDGAVSLATAAREVGLRRVLLVSVSGGYIEKNDDAVTRWAVKPLLQRILKNGFADADAMEHEIRASGLDWTIVRPPRLTNGPRTGRYRTAAAVGIRGGYTAARADVADCLLHLVDQPDAIGATITVAR